MASRKRTRLIVYQDHGLEWRWRAVAPNKLKTADSAEGYATKANAMRAARAFLTCMATAEIEVEQ